MRRSAAASSLLALALVVGACGAEQPLGGDDPTIEGAFDGCGSGADPGALEYAVEVDVPDDFELQPDHVGDTGPSDLDKAARDDSAPEARARLEGAQFLRGYQRLWVGPDYTELIAYVYEFCEPAGAQAFAPSGDYDGPGDRIDVAGLPGAQGWLETDELYTTAQILVVEGRFLILAVVAGETDTAEPQLATTWATDLARALVGRVATA